MLGITVLGSGSRGNALCLHSNASGILIDAGFSGVQLRKRMDQAGVPENVIQAILVSHEHDDHTKGIGVLSKHWNVPVYANRLTAEVLRDRGKLKTKATVFSSGSAFEVGEFRIEPFSIPHDAIDPVGFVVQWRDLRIGVATDLGHASSLVSHQLRNCDALILESNHDIALVQDSQRSWSLKQRVLGRHGHLSNDACINLLRDVLHERTRLVVLAHASQDCNCYDLVEQTGRKCLGDLGRGEVEFYVARQESFLDTVWL